MKMKKFMNAPETVTDEELVGLGLAYPDILNVDATWASVRIWPMPTG